MADKIPDFTLTPQDAPWGRWVTERLREAERERERAAYEQTAANKGLTASINSLADQIRDLTARRTYSSSGPDFSTSVVNSLQTGSPTARVDFVINEGRQVLFTASAVQTTFVSQVAGANTGALRASIDLSVDGEGVALARSDGTLQFTTSGPARYQFSGGTLLINYTATLPAGAHYADITPRLYLSGDVGNGAISVLTLTAQILDPTGA